MIKNKEVKYLLSESLEEADSTLSPSKMDAIYAAHKMKKIIEESYYQDIEVEDDESVVPWDALREATWDQTSITQDMRRMNTQRLLSEIRGQISRIAGRYRAVGGGFATTANTLYYETENMLQRYRDMGALRGFTVGGIEQTMSLDDPPEVTMNLTIVPNATLERINIDVRLHP